jgi:hypothetical protein
MLYQFRLVSGIDLRGAQLQGLKSMKETIVPAIYREENLDEKLIVSGLPKRA